METKRPTLKEEKLKRNNRLSMMLNKREMKALGIYCDRYRIKNRSSFIRETVMKAILKRFDEEHPTLWEDNEPTLFNQNISARNW
jgi:hypothetical protein